ncbi:hypothetical protein EDC04DRAFT_2705711 [Pisolithus marmoratus]|nr:hypothetical protein EDC04DRAFT_2705711 [Pisolithus marmoratus]
MLFVVLKLCIAVLLHSVLDLYGKVEINSQIHIDKSELPYQIYLVPRDSCAGGLASDEDGCVPPVKEAKTVILTTRCGG